MTLKCEKECIKCSRKTTNAIWDKNIKDVIPACDECVDFLKLNIYDKEIKDKL